MSVSGMAIRSAGAASAFLATLAGLAAAGVAEDRVEDGAAAGAPCAFAALRAYGLLESDRRFVMDVHTRRSEDGGAFERCMRAIRAESWPARGDDAVGAGRCDVAIRDLLAAGGDVSLATDLAIVRRSLGGRVLEDAAELPGWIGAADAPPRFEALHAAHSRLLTENRDVRVDRRFAGRGNANITAGRWPIAEYGLAFAMYPFPLADPDAAGAILHDHSVDGGVRTCRVPYRGFGGPGSLVVAPDPAVDGLPTRCVVTGSNGRVDTVLAIAYRYVEGVPWPHVLASVTRVDGAVFARATRIRDVVDERGGGPLRVAVDAAMPVFEHVGEHTTYAGARYRSIWPAHWRDLLELVGEEREPHRSHAHGADAGGPRGRRLPWIVLGLAAVGAAAAFAGRRRRGSAALLLLPIALVAAGCRGAAAMSETAVDVGEVRPEAGSVDASVTITNPGPDAWTVAAVRRSCRCLRAGISEGTTVPGGGSVVMNVSIAVPDTLGPFTESLVVVPREARRLPHRVVFRGTVTGEVVAAARSLRFLDLEPGERRRFTLPVLVAPQVDFGRVRVEGAPAYLSWRRIEAGTETRGAPRAIEFSVDTDAVPGSATRMISLAWDSPKGGSDRQELTVVARRRAEWRPTSRLVTLRREESGGPWRGTVLLLAAGGAAAPRAPADVSILLDGAPDRLRVVSVRAGAERGATEVALEGSGNHGASPCPARLVVDGTSLPLVIAEAGPR